MKTFSLYLVEFSEDKLVLSKDYSKDYFKDYQMGGPKQRQIVMIINDKNTFSGNNGEYRMWTLDSHSILQPKGRGKANMILDFLFP